MEKKNVIDKLIDIIKETEEQNKILQSQNTGWRKELRERFDWTQNTTIKGKVELEKFIQELLDKAREEGREELLDSIVVGIEQLKSIVTMFNPMSTEIRAKQSGEIEAYDGLLEKLSKLKDNK